MTFYIAAPTSLDVERSLIKALETMGFEKDQGDCEISEKNQEIYSIEIIVGQVGS